MHIHNEFRSDVIAHHMVNILDPVHTEGGFDDSVAELFVCACAGQETQVLFPAS